MQRKFLDTNRLFDHFRRKRAGRRHEDLSAELVTEWARELIGVRGVNAILTPVVIEFLAGAASHIEVNLAKAYLGQFEIADAGDIRREDWTRAQGFAERVPSDGRPRQLGDCLLAAIAERLRLTPDTADLGFPRPGARPRVRRRKK